MGWDWLPCARKPPSLAPAPAPSPPPPAATPLPDDNPVASPLGGLSRPREFFWVTLLLSSSPGSPRPSDARAPSPVVPRRPSPRLASARIHDTTPPPCIPCPPRKTTPLKPQTQAASSGASRSSCHRASPLRPLLLLPPLLQEAASQPALLLLLLR